jgi:hypothetical protein
VSIECYSACNPDRMPASPSVFIIQAVRWTLGGNDASQYGGPVTLSETGAYVAYTRGDDTVIVLDGTTGAPRGEAINMG